MVWNWSTEPSTMTMRMTHTLQHSSVFLPPLPELWALSHKCHCGLVKPLRAALLDVDYSLQMLRHFSYYTISSLVSSLLSVILRIPLCIPVTLCLLFCGLKRHHRGLLKNTFYIMMCGYYFCILIEYIFLYNKKCCIKHWSQKVIDYKKKRLNVA